MVRYSIIMPTFNRREIIISAIESILKCDFKDYELIIVDDGSTDDTQNVLMLKYANLIDNKQIKYFYIKGRRGVSFCRNVGLKNSTGTWIGYLDSDNKLLPNYFNSFDKAISKNPETQLFYGQYITKSGKKGKSQPYIKDSLKKGNYIDLGVVIHSRTLYTQFGGFDDKLNRLVDWDLLLTYTEHTDPLFIDCTVMEYNDDDRDDRITKKESMSLACTKISFKHTLNIPTVCTIIPTYNHEKYIDQAIDSAISQDGYFIHKILISDDCSTDNTRKIIYAYCNKYPELITDISDNTSLGISNNYHKCFLKSNSTYTSILEGDDYWISRHKLKNQLKYLEEYPECNLVFSNILLLKNNFLEYQGLQGKINKTKLYVSDFFKYNLNPIINFSCCMFRTAFLKSIPEVAYTYRISEITLGLLCAEHSYVGYIQDIQGVYRIHDNGVWSGLDKNDKLYSAYKVRYVAAQCVSKKIKKQILALLYKEYIQNDNFLKYLADKDSILDIKTYVKSNYDFSIKIISDMYRISKKIPISNRFSKKSISDLKAYQKEVIRLADSKEIEASIILMFLTVCNSTNKSKAEQLLRELLNQKHTSKDYLTIARAYRDGVYVNKNLQESIKWMTYAASQGNKWSRIELISLLMRSQDENDHKKAFELAKEISSDLSDIHRKDALIRLARMYANGVGTKISLQKATEIYSKIVLIEEKIVPEYVNLLYKNPLITTSNDLEKMKLLISKDFSYEIKSKIALIMARNYKKFNEFKQSEQYYDLSIQFGNNWAIIEKISFLVNTQKNGVDALKLCEHYENNIDSKYLGYIYVNLARIYLGEIGIKQNKELTEQYYRRAIDYGVKISKKELDYAKVDL